MFLCSSAQDACSTGYYLFSGSCQKCMDICVDCVDGTSCTACPNNMYLDSSNQCKLCENGEYYDSTSQICRSCNGNCKNLCAYQSFCFDCPSGQIFHLKKMTCTESCDSSSIPITDAQFWGKSICRGFNYYINPNSQEIIELGTQAYPFKNIGLAFVEILNYHSHSNRTINVYLLENTDNYLLWKSNFVINMTLVVIQSYSVNTPSTSQMANIFIKSEGVSMLSSQTVFCILMDNSLRLDTILHTDLMEADEISNVQDTVTAFTINRSSFTMNKINIVTQFSDSTTKVEMIRSTYNMLKTISLTNMFVQIQGDVIRNMDVGSNFYTNNVKFDFYSTISGIDYDVQCNFPEAILNNTFTILNSYFYNSQARTQLLYTSCLLTGDANVTTVNNTWLLYGSSLEDSAPFEVTLNSNCIPMDGQTRIAIFNNSYMTLPSNPDGIMYNQFYSEHIEGVDRTEVIYFSNNYVENILDNIYAVLDTYLQPNTQLFIENNYFVNVSGLFGALQMTDSGYATVINNTYINSTNFGFGIIEFNNVDGAKIDGFYIDNVIATGDDSQNLFYAMMTETSILMMNDIVVTNSKINNQKMIYCDTFVLNFILTNSNFKNLTISSGVSLINLDSTTILNLDNINFSNIMGDSTDSVDSYAILLSRLSLAGIENSTIKRLSLTNSLIGLFYFYSISDSPPESRLLSIDDITISNCDFYSFYNLIAFGGIITSEDFQIMISEISYQNISFYFSGNLLYYQSQMINQILINNLFARNISGGSISVEAFDKNNLELSASIRCVNITTDSINAGYSSFILINEGGFLDIINSNFQKIMSYESGSVLSAGYQKSTTNIYNSTFQYNSAINAGVFQVKSESVVKIYNSTIKNNFALEGGVSIASTNGYFEIYNTTIFENYALSVSTIEVFDVATSPIISGCYINNNVIMQSSTLFNEIKTSCSKLCFLQNSFKELIISMESTLSLIASRYSIQLISGQLSIQDNSIIENQSLVIQSFSSILTIKSSLFQNITFSDSSIVVINSNCTIQNSSANSISVSEQNSNSFLSVSFGSTMVISNFTFESSTASLITSDTSTLTVDKLNITNVQCFYYLVSLSQSIVSISNSKITNVKSSSKTASIYSINSNIVSMNIIQISNINQIVILAQTSTFSSVLGLNISNCTQGLKLLSSSSINIQNSMFNNLGSNKLLNGAALLVENSNLTIQDSFFNYNTAQYGGAIDLSCSLNMLCTYQINSCNFTNNKAIYYGGAIKYDLYRPTFTSNIFNNNSAGYGSDIASYPIKIKIKDSNSDSIQLTNVGSGVVYDKVITFVLVDYDNQINTLDDSSLITIKSINSKTSVLGTNFKKVENGEAVFSSIIFASSPGEENVNFSISSSSINSQVVNTAINNYTQNPVQASFRYCMPGEIVQNNKCVICSSGTYSFTWNSTKCDQCMANSNCLGGTVIYGDSGYWRLNKNSTLFYECLLPAACNGGYNETSTYPVNCAVGYEGILCAQCTLINNEKYERVGNYECAKCPDPILNALKVVGLLLIVLLFLVIQIIMNLRKRDESQASILMRILTNYLQVITAVLSFNIKFPNALSDIFTPIDKIGSSSEPFVSFDCFVQNSKLTLFTPSTSIFKIFLSATLPIFFFISSVIACILLYCIIRKWGENIKRNIIVSNIVILFILHPTITKSFLSLFKCVQISPDESRVSINVDIVCYSEQHLFWCAVLGVPSLLIWTFGIPFCAFLLLFKHRKELDVQEIKKYYLMLYQGLKPNCFYWEFMNTIRKMIILLINVFLSTYSLFFRILPLVILLILFFRIQLRLEPYKLQNNNKLERAEIIAGAITLFGGMLFIDQQNNFQIFNTITFILIVVVNCYFFVLWFYCILSTLKTKYRLLVLVSSLMAYFLRIRDDQEDIEYKLNAPKDKKSKKRVKIFKTKKTKASDKIKKLDKANKFKNLKGIIKQESFEQLDPSKEPINPPASISMINNTSSKIKYIDESIMHNQELSSYSKDVLQVDFPDKEYVSKHFSKNKDEENKSLVQIFKENSRIRDPSFSDTLFNSKENNVGPKGENALSPFKINKEILERNNLSYKDAEQILNTNKDMNSFSSISDKRIKYEVLKKVEKIFDNSSSNNEFYIKEESKGSTDPLNFSSSLLLAPKRKTKTKFKF